MTEDELRQLVQLLKKFGRHLYREHEDVHWSSVVEATRVTLAHASLLYGSVLWEELDRL